MATHDWPNVREDLRLVPKSDADFEREIAANRSIFEDTMPRLAPLRQRRAIVPLGRRSRLRKVWLVVRDTWRFIKGRR